MNCGSDIAFTIKAIKEILSNKRLSFFPVIYSSEIISIYST